MTRSRAAATYMRQTLRVSMAAILIGQGACVGAKPARTTEETHTTPVTAPATHVPSALEARNAQHAATAIPQWGKEHGFRMGKISQIKVEAKENGMAEGTYEAEFLLPTDKEGVDGVDTFVVCDTDSSAVVGTCDDVKTAAAKDAAKESAKTKELAPAKPIR